MELYRQTTKNIAKFEAPSADTVVTATASLNGGDAIALTVNAEPDQSLRTATIPFIPTDGQVSLTWNFEATTFNGVEEVAVTDYYDVVTPILTDIEIKNIHPNATPEEIISIEKATRHIIQSHTGQSFGFYSGVIRVQGTGHRSLNMPRRLIELRTVNGDEAGGYFEIGADGWALFHFPWGVPPIKADFFGLHRHTNGVIHNPNHVSLGEWMDSRGYDVEGDWGYLEVPSQVEEAAKLLVNDYACADQMYRDRYLTSMTAADWRIQYHSGAFRETGNVRADQLLNDYVLKRGWAVI